MWESHLFETTYKMNISLLYSSCYLTSMFLLATFFTTAGNSSDEFFPMAMSWAQNKQQNSSIHWPSHYFHLLLQLRGKLKESHFPWCTHPDDPFHGLQFERLLVALQHLLKVLIPVGRPVMLSTPAVVRAQVSLNNQPHLLLLEQKVLRAVCRSSTCFPDESLHMQRWRWLQENFHINESDSWKHNVSSLHRKILNYFREIERPNRNNRGGMTM